MKKIFALVLAVLLVAASLTVALAGTTPTHSITITNQNTSISINGKTYSAYKLFDSTKNGTAVAYTMRTSSEFYSASLIAETAPTSGLPKLLREYFDFVAIPGDSTKVNVIPKSGFNAAAARTFADDIQQYLTGKTATAYATASGETAVIDLDGANAGLGYYIVTGSAKAVAGGNAADAEVVSAVILTNEDPNPVVAPKADAPGLKKEITKVTENNTVVPDAVLDENGKAAVAKIGSTVSYKLTSKVPDLTGYDDYTFTFYDTLSEGLDYVSGSFELKIGTATVSINPDINGRSFSLTIPYDTLKNYTANTAITLTYDATVNSTALTYDYENNSASLEYSNSPYDENTNHTPDQKTYVIDLNLDVLKVKKGDDNTKLDGATFKLYRTVGTGDSATTQYYKWDTTNNKVTWVTDASEADQFVTGTDGKFTQQVRGLDKGTYYLVETAAPQGYNPLTAPIPVVISVNETTNQVTYTTTFDGEAATMTNGTVSLSTSAHTAAQPVATGKIENSTGTELPSTGGIGTTIFYVAGSILVLAAVILLVTKRRMNANDD